MNLKLLLLLTAIVFFRANAQTPILTNSQRFSDSPAWNFICENYAFTGAINVQIARTEKGGVMKLFLSTTNTTFTISGKVYVFLKDNTIITCSDKGQHHIEGNLIASDYYFSMSEMNKLKRTDIESIHFNIKGNRQGFDSQTGNFTALNKKNYFTTAFDQTKKSYNTAEAVTALYK